jgi:hypothetical protein
MQRTISQTTCPRRQRRPFGGEQGLGPRSPAPPISTQTKRILGASEFWVIHLDIVGDSSKLWATLISGRLTVGDSAFLATQRNSGRLWILDDSDFWATHRNSGQLIEILGASEFWAALISVRLIGILGDSTKFWVTHRTDGILGDAEFGASPPNSGCL